MRSFTIQTCTTDQPIQVDADEVEIGTHFLIFKVNSEPVFLIATHVIQTIRGTDPRVTDSRPVAAAAAA